jgi:hypothetical protein
VTSVGEIGAVDRIGSTMGVRQGPVAAVAAPPQRALVALAPARPSRTNMPGPGLARAHATAPFLTHLIATEQGAPQTRARRRADPNWAIATYATAMRAPHAAAPAVSAIR